jgi:hypothetical protein
MANDTDSEERTPQKLLYEAHKRAAEERQRVSAAPILPDSMLDTQVVEIEYHAAVMEYFNRLKPHLPDRPEFWNRVPLWNDPPDGQRKEIAESMAEFYGIDTSRALGVLDMLEDNEQFPEVQPRTDETVRGLKHLVHWRGKSTTEQVERHDVIDGSSVKLVERPIHLPRDVAMRVHDALDEAAAELGFNVRPGKDIAKSSLDGESGSYEVEEVEPDT